MFKKRTFNYLTVLTALCILLTSATAVNASTGKDKGKIQPQWVVTGDFSFTPHNASRNSTVYAEGDQSLTTLYLADGHFEMLLDGRFNQPSVVARQGVPNNPFEYRYHSEMGENCWVYNSGTIWYTGSYYMYLKASTSSPVLGLMVGKQGSNAYIPDAWWVDSCQIS